MITVKVYITLKAGVLDPQGEAVKGGLVALGYRGVQEVRVGKYLELKIDAAGSDAALAQAEEMCRQLLANPVIEDFRLEV